MPREVAKTTTKSKTLRNKIQQTFVKLCRRKLLSPPPFPPRLHGSPRYPQMFLKNMLKLL